MIFLQLYTGQNYRNHDIIILLGILFHVKEKSFKILISKIYNAHNKTKNIYIFTTLDGKIHKKQV